VYTKIRENAIRIDPASAGAKLSFQIMLCLHLLVLPILCMNQREF